ncbi:hypothetical protein AAMO2058_000388400 [Amorphochlora amoebiformis]
MPPKWIYFDRYFIGMTVGVLVMDLCWDSVTLLDKSEEAYALKATFYSWTPKSPLIVTVVPVIIVGLVVGAVARAVYTPGLLSFIYFPFLVGAMGLHLGMCAPAQQRVVEALSVGIPDIIPTHIKQDMDLNILDHSVLLVLLL